MFPQRAQWHSRRRRLRRNVGIVHLHEFGIVSRNPRRQRLFRAQSTIPPSRYPIAKRKDDRHHGKKSLPRRQIRAKHENSRQTQLESLAEARLIDRRRIDRIRYGQINWATADADAPLSP
jgi:hypothetical protein